MSHTPTANARRTAAHGFLSEPQPVHFVGIGGSGMSGLAECLLRCGFPVSGSDASPSAVLDRLGSLGADVRVGHSAEHVPPGARLVVRTLAVDEGNPEVARALAGGATVIRYADLLGRVMADRFGIAVSGCHGKTTTTAMIAHALHALGRDPSFVVGGVLQGFGSGSHVGDGPHFVAEACEYQRSFHFLHACVAVVTNIEADHLDYYKDLDEIVDSFAEFLAKVPADGHLVTNGDDSETRRAGRLAVERHGAAASPVTFGREPGNDWRLADAEVREGCGRAQVHPPGCGPVAVRLPLPGLHNLWNATAAIVALAQAGVAPADAAGALESFAGVERRMQRLAEKNGCLLMDDYAHHPTEVEAVLRAARRIPGIERILAVFQPHQHGRTRRHLEDFGRVLALADLVLIPGIYTARETEADRRSVGPEDVVRAVCGQGGRAEHIPDSAELVRRVGADLRPGTLALTMGAGDVWKISEALRRGPFEHA